MRAYTIKAITRKPVPKAPNSYFACITPTSISQSAGEVDTVDEDGDRLSVASLPRIDPSTENHKKGQDLEHIPSLENTRTTFNMSETKSITESPSIDGSPTLASLLSRSHSTKSSLSGIMRLVKLPTAELASLGRSMAHRSARQSISSQSTVESFELEISWMQMVNSLRNMYGTYSMVSRIS